MRWIVHELSAAALCASLAAATMINVSLVDSSKYGLVLRIALALSVCALCGAIVAASLKKSSGSVLAAAATALSAVYIVLEGLRRGLL